MSSYQDFAAIYETFMFDAPYTEWFQWLQGQFPGLPSMKIADIGCGTGTLTRMLARSSNTVIGVDPSESMLGTAQERALADRVAITWYCQNAASLHLPQAQDLLVSSCDSLNYIVDEEEFRQSLRQIWQVLLPGGYFAFDIIGEGRLEQLNEGLSYDLRSDAAIIFETTITENTAQTMDIVYELSAFVRTGSGLYRRFDETHRQRFYPPFLVSRWLQESGFQVLSMTGDFTEVPLEDAKRIVFLAQRPL